MNTANMNIDIRISDLLAKSKILNKLKFCFDENIPMDQMDEGLLNERYPNMKISSIHATSEPFITDGDFNLYDKNEKNVYQSMPNIVISNSELVQTSIDENSIEDEDDSINDSNHLNEPSDPPSLWFDSQFPFYYHHAKLGEHTVKLWIQSNMTDVVIRIKERSFQAHKAVLTCYCPFFKSSLLIPNHQYIHGIELQNVEIEAFEVLLTYMYTGRLQLTCENLGDVYQASRLLQMKEITQTCSQILSGKIGGVVSTMYLYVTARKLGIEHAWQRAFNVIISRFEEVADSNEFLQLSVEDVCEILNSPVLGVHSEISVFLAALKWIHFKFLDREKYSLKIMNCVRFPLMSLEEILNCFHPPILPGLIEIPELKVSMLKATCFIAAKIINKGINFRIYSVPPRHYLLKGKAILWDMNRFNPYYYTPKDRENAAKIIQQKYLQCKLIKLKKREEQIRNKAAIQIQAWFRGNIVRQQIKSDERLESSELDLSIDPSLNNFISQSFSIKPPENEVTFAFKELLKIKNMTTILSFGGIDPFRIKEPLSGTRIVQFNPVEDYWKDIGKMPFPRHNHSAIIYKDNIFVIGGADPWDTKNEQYVPTNSCFSYNLIDHSWKKNSALNQARIYHGTAVFRDKLYVIGGKSETGRLLDTIESFNIEQDEWVLLKKCITRPRMAIGIAVYDNFIWIVGGMIQIENEERIFIVRDVECLNPEDNIYISKPQIPIGCSFSSLCVVKNKLYLLGGTSLSMDLKKPQLCSNSDVYVFNLELNHWKKGLSLPSPRHSCSTAVIDGALYIIGGLSTFQNTPLNEVVRFQEETESWEQCNPFPSPYTGSAFITISSRQSSEVELVQDEESGFVSPLSNCFSNRNSAAASLILLKSIQKA